MININELTEKDKGKRVIYHAGYLKSDGTEYTELGIIKSWNDKFIFVVYKCDGNWNNYTDYTAAATDPKDLTFVKGD